MHRTAIAAFTLALLSSTALADPLPPQVKTNVYAHTQQWLGQQGKKPVTPQQFIDFVSDQYNAELKPYSISPPNEDDLIAWEVGEGVLGFLAALALLRIAALGFYTVQQQSRAVIQRFGKFHAVTEPGWHWKLPIIDKIAKVVWLRTGQLIVNVETKTSDNVFVIVPVAIQWRVIPDKAADFFYTLIDPDRQISSYVFDVVRATVPFMALDHVFEKKDDVAKAVKERLTAVIQSYGAELVDVLVTDIVPDAGVKQAMNEIQRNTRLQVAATAQGEAAKILTVKNAEAEAESKRLQGQGIANQRIAIAKGLQESLALVTTAGVSPKEASEMVMLTQYFDTMKEIGVGAGSRVIFTPNDPAGLSALRRSIMEASAAT